MIPAIFLIIYEYAGQEYHTAWKAPDINSASLSFKLKNPHVRFIDCIDPACSNNDLSGRR